MTTPKIDGREIGNTAYHATIVSGLAAGFSYLGKKVFKKTSTPKFDFNGADIMMMTLNIGLAMAKDMLVKQGILPEDILK